MPQDPLDYLVLDPEVVEVGRQSSAEGVPAAPLQAGTFQRRDDRIPGQDTPG